MTSSAQKLIAGAIALALLAAGFCYVRELRAELARASLALDDARHAVAARDGTIAGLREDATEKAQQQQKLDVSTDKVAAKVEATRLQIEKVLHENPIARTWADTPLPDDVARLSASPAYAGADDFGSAVPDRDAVRAAGDGAAH